MPRRGRPPKRRAPTEEVATPTAATDVRPTRAPQKTLRRRTPQTPMEMAAEEVVYMVERIIGMRWAKGDRQYHVVWEGYEEKDSTWEPMENLVGCAAQIRA